MFKVSYHPKAFLTRRKNVPRGLGTRTKILSQLEKDTLTARILNEKTRVSYSALLHHLHLMEDEHVVTRQGGRPYLWKLTGLGQKRLIET